MDDLHPDWTLTEEGHLTRTLRFPDFAAGLAFVNLVGAAAEDQDHHPDLLLRWGSVRIELWSHDAGRVTERDRRLARAIDRLADAGA
jgi:4a-hydroxytetrahydrobiopterin dehydratase